MARSSLPPHALPVAALCSLLTCGAAAAPAPTPANGGTAVYADQAEPREINCIRANDTPALRICRLVADTLVDYDRDLRIIPRLAESFEASADGKSLTFHLRKGVRWHDGRPFTSADVLYTIEQIRAPGANIAGNRPALFEPLVAIDAPDAYTVISRFREPYALAYQAWAKTFIAPAHLRFEPGKSSPADRAPVGTGAFKFVRWDAQDKIVLDANPDYFAGRPHLDRFITRYISDDHTIALALRSGDVDLASMKAPEIPAEESSLPYRVLRYPSLSLDAIIWNTAEPRHIFADSRVRRAMSMLIDRQAYVDRILMGNGQPAVSSFVPAMWAHDGALLPEAVDPNGASALLASAGWRDRNGDGVLDTPSGPASFTLLFSPRVAEHESLATVFQAAARTAGIRVSLEALDWNAYLDRVRRHGFEAAMKRWGLDTDPDPFDFFHSSQTADGQNYGGYTNAEVDRLALDGRRTLSQDGRAEIYHRLERLLVDEQPYAFIAHPSAIIGVSKRLKGVEVAPTGILSWYPAAIAWWIAPPGEPGRR